MHHFAYRDGVLHAEDVPLTDLAAAHGTPTYVYARATLRRHFRVMDEALGSHPRVVCFAVKANPSLGVLETLGRMGAGADVVSGGELYRALKAGIPGERIVFSGVGKTADEMRQALQAGIRAFHLESAPEMELLDSVAQQLGRVASVSLRVNPDVDAATHPYISTGMRTNKFGIPMAQAVSLVEDIRRRKGLRLHGVACHIGSQITQLPPIREAAHKVVGFARELRSAGHPVREISFGGGLGITYRDETPPNPAEYARVLAEAVGDSGLSVILEPGRVIVGNAGVLLGRVLYVKDNGVKTFVITDVGMNDLMRPALYSAWHQVLPVRQASADAPQTTVDVVGPVCESADFIARDRTLPPLAAGDLICVMSAGAYGFSMASNYNSRPRPAEVMVDGGRAFCIRSRETYEDLLAHERAMPD
ncbi:MAG: diaminopimelate decarboxylase [Myxococcota bacterium]